MDGREKLIAGVLVLVISGSVGCGGSKTTPAANQGAASPVVSESGGDLRGGEPQTNHTVLVTATTNPGSSANPAIETNVSLKGLDTITWSSTGGKPKVLGLPVAGCPYPKLDCTTSGTQCTSGPLSSTCVIGAQYDYTLGGVLSSGGVIYGRIIIVKP